MDNNFILSLYTRPQTVFSFDEIAQLFPDIPYDSLRGRLHYFTKINKLIRIQRGIYAKIEYSHYEIANKLYTPSYISLETVLSRGGVTFQYYETIFAISYITRALSVQGVAIQYRRINSSILTNADGVEHKEGYAIATLERAFLDAVYIYKNYHFDNLGVLNWEKVENLKKLYHNKAFEKRVESYHQLYKEEYGKH
ncbi:hypothetical protein HGA88_05375 [Candidatus Roizmanbacteria bacterium]|nr:hypothetical protein [Candidatus Roizmanbacteria bacterium]